MGGILRHFRTFSTPEQNAALEVLSTPAHPQDNANRYDGSGTLGKKFKEIAFGVPPRKDGGGDMMLQGLMVEDFGRDASLRSA